MPILFVIFHNVVQMILFNAIKQHQDQDLSFIIQTIITESYSLTSINDVEHCPWLYLDVAGLWIIHMIYAAALTFKPFSYGHLGFKSHHATIISPQLSFYIAAKFHESTQHFKRVTNESNGT